MNRKEVLKKVKDKKNEKNNIEDENYFGRFVKILTILIILLFAGYLIIGIFVNKTISFGKKDKEEEKSNVSIDNDVILAGQIFEQKEDEYYVLVYDKNDSKTFLNKYLSLYDSKEDNIKIYSVDSSSKFNSNFIVLEDSNKNPDSYENLKIVSPSLIKISNKKVTEYIEGENEIIEVLKK